MPDPKMMDPGAREIDAPVPFTNHPRNAYALDTLAEEVGALFTDVTTSFEEPDGRNTNLAVRFVLNEEGEQRLLGDLLGVLIYDPRIEDVVTEDGVTMVSVHGNPRTQDDREPFNLGAAYDVMIEDDLWMGSV